MKRLFVRGLDRSFMAIAAAMPTSLVSHLLLVLRDRPDLTDKWGYHIRPIHYYEPFPDPRCISTEMLERDRVSPVIDFRFEAQRELICRLGNTYGAEITQLANAAPPDGFDFANPYFAGLDAAVYYALIRDQKPKCIVEIGSGYSTQIASLAAARNREAGDLSRLVCIEPFPDPRLTQSSATFELIQKRVQDVPLGFFEQLKAGDILLIDSSHVATAGGDVNYEFLDILPRLAPGIWVHVHDIFLPRDYPAEWVIERRLAFNEQYLLEAFLAFNRSFSVQAANAWLWREHGDDARRLFDGSASVSPTASLWMRREG